eukprot:gnl/MRDRNA2_/MRDRNA2_325573_c0_seq1.p1 gnl/MRDRNA2_/MRDRNA2_325573_c0~~gnl/MRDRNA2_/MRDRNA2_325573_c0_seq1.p1  ORF type:complete len:115 (-),score=10.24 gnl/MRDRNA2_/MRDRNA2_325573_c0_seq1:65-409(-)
MHLSAIWHSLGRLATSSAWGEQVTRDFEKLIQHTVRAAAAGDLSARVISNVAYGAAQIRGGKSMNRLFQALAGAAEASVSDFNAQDISNTAWAFATAEQSDAQLFTALARAVTS